MEEVTISLDSTHGTTVSSAFVGTSIHGLFAEYRKKFNRTAVIVGKGVMEAREDLVDLYCGGGTECSIILIEDGEEAKSFKSYAELVKKIAEAGIQRNDLIAYIGGGTTGDISGFVASTYLRGVKLCAIPTTLLAQVDSSIGGKNGINVSGVKNIVGTFHNPERIFCDTEFLRGMDAVTLGESLSEILKYGITGDPDIIGILERYSSVRELIESEGEVLITKSITVKKDIVEMDPFETREVRQILNAGHTIAHALEGSSSNRITHGRAVLIGLMAEIYISDRINGRESGLADTVRSISDRYSLDYSLPDGITAESLTAYASKDKKIEGEEIVFPVLISPGNVGIKKVETGKLLELIREWHMKQKN